MVRRLQVEPVISEHPDRPETGSQEGGHIKIPAVLFNQLKGFTSEF